MFRRSRLRLLPSKEKERGIKNFYCLFCQAKTSHRTERQKSCTKDMGMLFTDVTSMQLIFLPLDESYCVLDKKMQLIFEIRTLIESFESTTHAFLAENYREVQFLHS